MHHKTGYASLPKQVEHDLMGTNNVENDGSIKPFREIQLLTTGVLLGGPIGLCTPIQANLADCAWTAAKDAFQRIEVRIDCITVDPKWMQPKCTWEALRVGIGPLGRMRSGPNRC